jgi:integrase
MSGLAVIQQGSVDGAGVFLAIERAQLADSTKAQYKKAVTAYLGTGASLTDGEALADYAAGLPKSSKAFLKAAVRLFAQEAAITWKGQATPANVATVQAAVYRLEALQSSVKVETSKGTKAHSWLSATEVRRLIGTVNNLRDRVALGLLVGAGLRRDEAVNLTFADVVKLPHGERGRVVLNVCGKGDKLRQVPISDALAADIAALAAELGGVGRVLRNRRHGRVGGGLSAVGLFEIVRTAGAAIGKDGLAPHDLRRTYAQIGYEAGVPITQISTLLGHSSVTTTQRYLNLAVDLSATVSDFIPYA